jgi:CRISPR-associated protein Csb1
MANRLEEVCVADKYEGTLLPELAGLPYIRVMKGDRFMTASTLDGHRFASQYLLEGKGTETSSPVQKGKMLVDYLKSELGASDDGKNVPAANVPSIFRLAMELDPLSLIHGFQISSGKLTFVGLRAPRALTASIVGLNSEPIGVPGVKFDPIGTSDTSQAIFRKERIVAKSIQANFAIDIGLLMGLSVGAKPANNENDDAAKSRTEVTEHRRQLLVALSLWKIARFLKDMSEGHRLRTECDLVTTSVRYKTKWKEQNPSDFKFEKIVKAASAQNNDKSAASGSLLDLIAKAKLPSNRSPLTLEFSVEKKKKQGQQEVEQPAESSESEES